ncbi:uncharacterized protein A1O5_12313 [Cladophialophora psammophila CBS 110553]|uniref:Uncharacterized protein n=1 Tax=Cladophialophora psammophila CBS 110553 TaxID=1182543 RepID=W9VYF2_9EURO|nr:uncharacterized protein A1O5_12313 [Cladophialophora psammophila CBS 110553]EXJ57755.1 hypothetical protein A1O5_12313 [Cladophialophora psammophila CBS 110553]
MAAISSELTGLPPTLCEYLETRFEYFINTQDFFLRMPSAKYEIIQMRLIILPTLRLEQLYSQHQIQCPFSATGSGDIKIKRSDLKPDNQIRCQNLKRLVLVS